MSHTILLYESLDLRIESISMYFFLIKVTIDVLQKIVISTALTGVFLKDEDDLLSR
jgi:hypothetical protein